MVCCAIGAAIMAGVVWTVRFVRSRVLRRAPGTEAAAWRLQTWRSGTSSNTRADRRMNREL
jgi:hypothetical protein